MVQTGIDDEKRPVILVREIEKEGQKMEEHEHDANGAEGAHVHVGEENV